MAPKTDARLREVDPQLTVWYDVMFFDEEWQLCPRQSEYCITWNRVKELLEAYDLYCQGEPNELLLRTKGGQYIAYVSIQVSNEG